MNAWLLAVPVVFALLVVVCLPRLHGDDDTDRRLDRVDRDLDRENAGWRNVR